MTRDQIDAVLKRVPSWPAERQQQLVEIAREIEAEYRGLPYETTEDELRAIDEARGGRMAADLDEVIARIAAYPRSGRPVPDRAGLRGVPVHRYRAGGGAGDPASARICPRSAFRDRTPRDRAAAAARLAAG